MAKMLFSVFCNQRFCSDQNGPKVKPVTTVIIKTRLRNKMEDDYLANNLLVNIEGEILETYSYEDIIADFSGKKDRKADL
jgi:hypothetical protein